MQYFSQRPSFVMEENVSRQVQKQVRKFWDLVELFFRTKLSFLSIYQNYEREVISYAQARGVDRRVLRLNQEEVSRLIDFGELVRLRDAYLMPLKELSHEIFRSSDATDPFDRWVNSIFHEISILKEEHYKVKQIAEEYSLGGETEEFYLILDEVHEAFPRIIHHVYRLFEKATVRLEELLSSFSRAKILIRSTYLFGEDLFRQVYERGLEEFYEKMYPLYGAFEAYVVVAESFLGSGFLDEAKEAIQKATAYLEQYRQSSPEFQELYAKYTRLCHICQEVPVEEGSL